MEQWRLSVRIFEIDQYAHWLHLQHEHLWISLVMETDEYD